MYMHTPVALILFTNCGHTFILSPGPHLPSPIEVISNRKRGREVEGAEGVKRRKEDEEQHQTKRGKAVGTFVVAPEGVRKLICHACGCVDEM